MYCIGRSVKLRTVALFVVLYCNVIFWAPAVLQFSKDCATRQRVRRRPFSLHAECTVPVRSATSKIFVVRTIYSENSIIIVVVIMLLARRWDVTPVTKKTYFAEKHCL